MELYSILFYLSDGRYWYCEYFHQPSFFDGSPVISIPLEFEKANKSVCMSVCQSVASNSGPRNSSTYLSTQGRTLNDSKSKSAILVDIFVAWDPYYTTEAYLS